MNELILVRGVPGSGKSTLAKLISPNVVSADMYFEDAMGNYVFNPREIKDAHEWCRATVEKFMKVSCSKLVVANTFTKEWEMKPYFELAEKYGYRIHTIIAENRHGSTNIHGVPTDTVNAMRKRFEVKL
jgi:predicted kinase